jgi:hypothetical protein
MLLGLGGFTQKRDAITGNKTRTVYDVNLQEGVICDGPGRNLL